MDIGLGIDRFPDNYPILTHPIRNMLLGDGQHSSRAAAGIVDGADRAFPADPGLITREEEIHHQMDDIARGEVLPGIFIQRFVEFPDQLLEDRSHGRVVDLIRVEIDVLEAFKNLEDKAGFVQFADGVVEIEPLQHLPHVRAEAGDEIAEVGRQMGSVGEELLEVVAGGVIEGET